MSDLFGSASRVFTCTLTLFLAWGSNAAADKIGGTSLPASGPALKGRINDGEGATSVIVLTASAGSTSNAGPTFAETPSAFLDRGIGYAKFANTLFGRLDLNVNLSERLYIAFGEANERTGQAALSLTKDWGDQQTIFAFAFSKGRDIEERLTEASLVLDHAWTAGRAKPYVKAETALLDYGDVPEELQPLRNQDDRDRISSRVQAGLRWTLTEHVAVEVGGGVDTKRYLQRHDDFGVRRDSVSIFPLVGFSVTGEFGSLRAVYMPFRRNYREELFADTWKHGYAVEGEAKLSAQLKAFAAARYGFEETDFLIASSAYESVILGGLMLTIGDGNVSLAASRTERSYDGLDLVEVARADQKFEVALSGEMPLFDAFSLHGRISYLDYKSSFGNVGTDALAASLGLTYAVTQ